MTKLCLTDTLFLLGTVDCVGAPARPSSDRPYARLVRELNARANAIVGRGGYLPQTPIATPSPAPKQSEKESQADLSLKRVKANLAAALATLDFDDDAKTCAFTDAIITPAVVTILERHTGTARIEALASHLLSAYGTQSKERDRLFYLVDRDPSLIALKELSEFFLKARFERNTAKGQHDKSHSLLAFFHFIRDNNESRKARVRQEEHERSRARQGN